jgi:hypothetical protein
MDISKKPIGPAAIAGAVVLVVAVIYAIYHFTFAGAASNVRKENAPDYAKKAGMTNGQPGVPQATTPGAPPGGRPSYGQGAGYGRH